MQEEKTQVIFGNQDKIQYLRKQQQLLQVFYKDFFLWNTENVLQWIGVGIIEVIYCIFLWIPYQEMKDSINIILWMYFGIFGSMVYLRPYIRFKEDKKISNVYEKLKYLPITREGIRIFRFIKLTIFCLKMFVIFLTGQLFFSLVAFHEILWANIWYPTVFGFLLPFGVNTIALWWEK